MSVLSLMLLVHTDQPMAPSTVLTQGPRLTKAPSDLPRILLLWLSLSLLETSISVCLVHSLLRAQHAESIQSQLLNKWCWTLQSVTIIHHPQEPAKSLPSLLWDTSSPALYEPHSWFLLPIADPAFTERHSQTTFMMSTLCVNVTGCEILRYFVQHFSESVSVRVLWMKVNNWIGRMNKADCPPQCGWASSNQLRAWTEQKSNFLRNRTLELTTVSWEISLSIFTL